MVPIFIFFGFLLEERGGKICDFVTIGILGSYRWCGGVHIVGKERGEFGWVLFGGEVRWAGLEEGMSEWVRDPVVCVWK